MGSIAKGKRMRERERESSEVTSGGVRRDWEVNSFEKQCECQQGPYSVPRRIQSDYSPCNLEAPWLFPRLSTPVSLNVAPNVQRYPQIFLIISELSFLYPSTLLWVKMGFNLYAPMSYHGKTRLRRRRFANVRSVGILSNGTGTLIGQFASSWPSIYINPTHWPSVRSLIVNSSALETMVLQSSYLAVKRPPVAFQKSVQGGGKTHSSDGCTLSGDPIIASVNPTLRSHLRKICVPAWLPWGLSCGRAAWSRVGGDRWNTAAAAAG